MKMIWCGWKIKKNYHVKVNQFHGHFHSKIPSCRKIRWVFRDVKWCFIASWGLKGLNAILYRWIHHLKRVTITRFLKLLISAYTVYQHKNTAFAMLSISNAYPCEYGNLGLLLWGKSAYETKVTYLRVLVVCSEIPCYLKLEEHRKFQESRKYV